MRANFPLGLEKLEFQTISRGIWNILSPLWDFADMDDNIHSALTS